MDKFKGKKLRDYRKVYLVRYFNKPAWEEKCFVRFSDNGVDDVTEEQIREVKIGKGEEKKTDEGENGK